MKVTKVSCKPGHPDYLTLTHADTPPNSTAEHRDSTPTANNSIAPTRLPHHRCLIPNSLRTNSIQTHILPLMQPLLCRRLLLTLQNICRPKDRSARQVIRIDGDNPRILIVQLRKVARYLLGMGLAPVDADERRGDVCLLVEVAETEAGEVCEVRDDGGLVFGAEASAKVVLGLGFVAVDAVDEGWDGFGVYAGRGGTIVGHVEGSAWGELLRSTSGRDCWFGFRLQVGEGLGCEWIPDIMLGC